MICPWPCPCTGADRPRRWAGVFLLLGFEASGERRAPTGAKGPSMHNVSTRANTIITFAITVLGVLAGSLPCAPVLLTLAPAGRTAAPRTFLSRSLSL